MHDMRNGECPLCQHTEIVEGLPVDFAHGDPAEFAVAHERGFFDNPDKDAPLGRLRVFVCRRCGYVQWFADRPGDIPVGPEYRTRLVQGVERKAYR